MVKNSVFAFPCPFSGTRFWTTFGATFWTFFLKTCKSLALRATRLRAVVYRSNDTWVSSRSWLDKSKDPVLIESHLRWPRKRRSAALRARNDLIFFCWKAKLPKDFPLAFWYLYATDMYRWSWRSEKKHNNLNLFKWWLGPSKLLRCIYGCQKWIPDKIPHRNGNPNFFLNFFFVETKNIFWK